MLTVRDILTGLNKRCPFRWQEDFDNSGLQVGDCCHPCSRVLVALDMTGPVLAEGADLGVELIVTHHPLLFYGCKTIDAATFPGRYIYELIRHDMALISTHTNLDKYDRGVSRVLAERLGLKNARIWQDEGGYGFGMIGTTAAPVALRDFAAQAKVRLSLPGVRYCGDGDRLIQRVIVMGGSGGDFVEQAAGECDLYVCGDLKYHEGQKAREMGLTLLDCGHFGTESPVLSELAAIVQEIGGSKLSVFVAKTARSYWDVI